MIKSKYYCIHNIVNISVTADDYVLRQIDLHLAAFEVPVLKIKPDIILDCYDKAPEPNRATVVDDYDYGHGIIHRKSARYWISPESEQQLYYMDKLVLPINLIVQLALMKKNFTFIHGAAIYYLDKAILMPAYPGTGKTTLIAAFFNVGAKIFGDDLCILGNGRLYSYPQAFSVYPHHLAVLPYKDKNAEFLFKRTKYISVLSGFFEKFDYRVFKLIKFVLNQFAIESVNVMPELIFGSKAIIDSAPLSKVVVLERSGEINSLLEENVNISEISRQASTILWHEWHGSFHEILLYDAMAHSGNFLISLLNTVEFISRNSFEAVPCSRVKIPANWDNRRLVKEFPGFLVKF